MYTGSMYACVAVQAKWVPFRASSCLFYNSKYELQWAVVAPVKYWGRWAGQRGWLKLKGRERGSKLFCAQGFSYHTGYKGSRAARWELCSSPELVWWQGQSPEVQILEWWAEEELVEHTGLLGVCRNCNLFDRNKIIMMILHFITVVHYNRKIQNIFETNSLTWAKYTSVVFFEYLKKNPVDHTITWNL